MNAGDTPGHVDPDETDPFYDPQSSTDTTDEESYRVQFADPHIDTDDGESSGGFISGGLTTAESVVLVCLSFGSFGLAVFVLQVIGEHGLHHTPPLLWTLFAFLILLPLILTVGVAAGAGALTGVSGSNSGAESESPHDREGDSG